jgi:hypothetical protein
MDEVLQIALDGELTPLAKVKPKFGGVSPEPPVGTDSLAH